MYSHYLRRYLKFRAHYHSSSAKQMGIVTGRKGGVSAWILNELRGIKCINTGGLFNYPVNQLDAILSIHWKDNI